MALVSELMTREVRALAPDETVLDAAREMKELDVGVIPVCEGKTLVGIVTDRDIVLRAVAEGCAAESTPLSAVMSPDLHVCTEDESIEAVASEMRSIQIRRLPVVDGDDNLIGMISLGDIATLSMDFDAGELLRDISEPSTPDFSGKSKGGGARRKTG
jgi:CBS domain-containing protein